jgi:hypothetical protein
MIQNSISLLSILIGTMSFSSSQAAETLKMTGVGLDGRPCSVEIMKDGDLFRDLKVTGSARVFEILSDRGTSYGPRREILTNSAEKAFGILYDEPTLIQYATRSENWFSEGETYVLTSDDMPIRSEETLGGFSMKIQLELNYSQGQLDSVKSTAAFKVLTIAPVATATFTCEKE